MQKTKWPQLNYNDSKDTITTLMLFTQIVGKIRLRSMPWLNHSWHVTLYISAKGFTTGSMPYNNGVFELEFNMMEHHLNVTTSSGYVKHIALQHTSVAAFYKSLFSALQEAEINVSIYAVPNELETVIPFEEDTIHTTYNPEQAYNLWQALLRVNNIMLRFRAGFTGKCSPVHLFWGAFDLAVTRFSGRPAPLYTGQAPHMPLRVMQEAYSHEVSSCGFWPGSEAFPQAAFYAYCYPTPASFNSQKVMPAEAYFDNNLGEFLLPYNAVQQSDNPESMVLQFLQSTYEAAANTGNWNREELECDLTSFEKN